MNTLTSSNFGLLIAYLLPGFLMLPVVSAHSATVRQWLGAVPATNPTVGGFLYVTLASVAAGMTISAVRWLILDSLHHQSGIRIPSQNFAKLQANLAAFEGAVENHYRYYQFYGNTLIAIVISLLDPAIQATIRQEDRGLMVVVSTIICLVFFLASRDALRKYYAKTSLILGSFPRHEVYSHDKRLASNAGRRQD